MSSSRTASRIRNGRSAETACNTTSASLAYDACSKALERLWARTADPPKHRPRWCPVPTTLQPRCSHGSPTLGALLVISDDLPRSVRLVRALNLEHRRTVHDLNDEAAPLGQSDLIGSDVARLTSEAI